MRGATFSTDPRASLARFGLYLAAAHLLAFADRAKIAGLLPLIRADVPMSATAAGWVIGGAFTIGYVGALLVLAVVGSRAVKSGDGAQAWRIPVGIAIGTAASLATGLVRTLPELLAVRGALGVGQALFIPAAITLLADRAAPLEARTRGMARFLAAASLGRGGGLLLTAAAIGVIQALALAGSDWRWVFLLTTLPNLLLLLILRSRPALVSRPPAEPAPQILPPLPRRLRAAYLAFAVGPFVFAQGLLGWLPSLLTGRGLSVALAAGTVGTQALVVGAGGQLLGGVLMRRLGSHAAAPPLTIMAALTAAALLVVAGTAIDDLVATIVLLAAANLALAIALFCALFGWQQLLTPNRAMAGNGAFMGTVTFIGVGLGPVLAGAVADRSGDLATALALNAAGCTGWTLASGLLVLALYRRYKVPGAPA